VVEPSNVAPVAESGVSPDRQKAADFSFARIPIDPPSETRHSPFEEHWGNNTGLPDKLKTGIERLSGMALDDVRVHYHSPKPAKMQAWAYTQGTDILVGPGQEKYLAHEAWHIVQQKQERVKAKLQAQGMAINADQELEKEANLMGNKAVQAPMGRQGSYLSTFAHEQISLTHHAPTAPQAVIQAAWKLVPGTNPPQYYWDGRGHPTTRLPPGGQQVPAPPLQQLQDMHKGGGHGSMKSLRTDTPNEFSSINTLQHVANQAIAKTGSFYEGPTVNKGLGPQPVQTSVPHREPNKHTSEFSKMTGGERSATQYEQKNGMALPNTKYNITHGFGHGEGGKITQSPQNLASASEGANTEMIPFDKAISGNPKVLVDTSFEMRPGTHKAEVINQAFYHKDHPGDPFHQRVIDANRSKPTSREYEGWEEQAKRFKPDPLEAASGLINLGKLGFAPGNHPLDPRSRNDDDDDPMVT